MAVYFSKKVKARIATAPKTMGVQLWMWMVDRGLSVDQAAAAVGASRQTLYNWLRGSAVRHFHRERVARLIQILHDSETGEQAWQTACLEFNLDPSTLKNF